MCWCVYNPKYIIYLDNNTYGQHFSTISESISSPFINQSCRGERSRFIIIHSAPSLVGELWSRGGGKEEFGGPYGGSSLLQCGGAWPPRCTAQTERQQPQCPHRIRLSPASRQWEGKSVFSVIRHSTVLVSVICPVYSQCILCHASIKDSKNFIYFPFKNILKKKKFFSHT